MEFILNEKSLAAQFNDVNEFLQTLKNNIRCFQIIQNSGEHTISKTENFYDCHVTKEIRLCDLGKFPCSDELLDFQLKLENEIYTVPYWDKNPLHDLNKEYWLNGENVTATGIAEAVERDKVLLSFLLQQYTDCALDVKVDEKNVVVKSIYSPSYLAEAVRQELHLERDDLLKIKYENTRIDCSALEKEYGAEQLQDNEFEAVILSMNKFVNHATWEDIGHDDGLRFKKYKPKSPKYNWFSGTMYQKKDIMKFRASSVLRVFGYRKGEKFKVLRIERDHKYSDNG